MKINVEMWAFCGGKIREVEIPDEKIGEDASQKRLLNLAFHWGQNDFQPLPMPSVSVGDVVLLNGMKFMVAAIGWKCLDAIDYAYYVRESSEDRLMAGYRA